MINERYNHNIEFFAEVWASNFNGASDDGSDTLTLYGNWFAEHFENVKTNKEIIADIFEKMDGFDYKCATMYGSGLEITYWKSAE